MESITTQNEIQVEAPVKAKRVYQKRPKNIAQDVVPGETVVYTPPVQPSSAPIDIPKVKRGPSIFAQYYKENFNKYEGKASDRMKQISAEYRAGKAVKAEA